MMFDATNLCFPVKWQTIVAFDDFRISIRAEYPVSPGNL